MTHPPTSAPTSLNLEHRGWNLQAHWLRSISAGGEGWVCYATRPATSQKLNLGRWPTSELALEHGRAYVDRRVESPVQAGRRPNVPKRP